MTSIDRLRTVAPALADEIDRSDDAGRRRAAIKAAEFALDASSFHDQRLDQAMTAYRDGMLGESQTRSVVANLVESLDHVQWRLQQRMSEAGATEGEYLNAFSRARAAASVYYAGAADGRYAALEATYEATAVVDDIHDLIAVVSNALAGDG